MVVNLDRLYSDRVRNLKASDIRELLKLTDIPGMISLAGGLPNPKAFPVEIISECLDKVFKNDIHSALQYGASEGYPKLRKVLAERMISKKKVQCCKDDVLITNGSQQVLHLLSLILLNKGDTFIAGSPTYLAAIQVFHSFGAKCEPIPVEEDGMDLDSLRRNIRRLYRLDIHPKFIYTVPTFQNPSGVTMSAEKRKALLDLASEYDLLIIEDDPYGELRFEGDLAPPIKSLDKVGRVVYMSTFSKILAPGFRLGWTVAHKDILNKLVLTKQGADLCTNTFSQYVAHEYIAGGYLDKHIENIRDMYKRKRDVMLEALEEHFPEDVTWTRPNGGMFLWVTLPKHINARNMFSKALKKKVAFVVGDTFFPDGSGTNTMRLNFSFSSDEIIKEGVKRLSEVIKEEIEQSDEMMEPLAEGV